MGNEAQTKGLPSTLDRAKIALLAEIFAVWDQKIIAFAGGFLRIQRGLSIGLEFAIEKAANHRSTEMPDKARNRST